MNALRGLAWLLLLQAAGEAVAHATKLPIPGPVIGLALLLALLRWPVVRAPVQAAAELLLTTTSGREIHLKVEHAVGSLQRPMSDAQLRAKFMGQSEPVLGAERSGRSWELALSIAQCEHLHDFIAAAT